ncbi:MAG: pyridoxal phosphate-dependent aminotransferase [Lachnospirales bacterium]|nr:pyridoxal phosphate-dependent aminotransferase [Clostridiales bacterium]
MKLSQKAKNINPAITLALTSKAIDMIKDGIDVINFSSGEPDFETPDYIKKAGIDAIENFSLYSHSDGLKELREAIAKKLHKENNLKYNYNQIIVCHGAKQALNNAFFAILNEGDEVIIPAPYWTSYPEIVKKCGGNPVFIYTQKENLFKINVEMLKQVLTSKTKAIIINSPNNPTGMVYTEGELKQIADFVIENDLFVISDELYEKLIYSNKLKHISIASLGKEIYDRTIVINGFSKSYAMAGWRIGYIAANKKIADVMSNVQNHTTSSVNVIAQRAALKALTSDNPILEDILYEFKKRRDYTAQRISDIPMLSSLRPKGAFYQFIDVSKLFGYTIDDITIKDSEDVAKILLDKYRVCVVPCNMFGYEKYIRLSYTTNMQNIVEGINRIEQFIKQNF